MARRSGTCWCSQSLTRGKPVISGGRLCFDPYLTLEVWSSIDGKFEDRFFYHSEEVDAAVNYLQRGEWQPVGQHASSTYLLRWLDTDESHRVSAEVFGLDLAAERRRQKRPD